MGVQDRSERKDRHKGKASAKKQGEGGGTRRDIRRVKRISDWNENVIPRPNGTRENAEIAISSKGPGPARKNKVYQ